MNGILLLIPFLIIRFALLAILNPDAVRRAAHFAPMDGRERIAYYVYQVSNIGIFVYLAFLTVKADIQWLFILGLLCYVAGLGLCAAVMFNFSTTDDIGLNRNGLYRFSRNPMYVAYFICFAGMALLTKSWLLMGMIAIFQVSAHWIILAEERWCMGKFGAVYTEYMKSVRRYF